MKPTKLQMRKIEEVSIEEDGNFYYLTPGWRSEPGDEVHFILDAVNDFDYIPCRGKHHEFCRCARGQMKSVVPCDCEDCLKLIEEDLILKA